MTRVPEMVDLAVRVEDGCGVVAWLAGELDLATAGQLEQQLFELVDDGPDNIVLDLAQVTFMDSWGLGALVNSATRMRERRGRLVLRSPTRAVEKLLSITGAAGILPTIQTASTAG